MTDEPSGPSTPVAQTPSAAPQWERETIEKLLFATLREQQAARRWRLFSRLLWIALFAAVVWLIYVGEATTTTTSSPHTGRARWRGALAVTIPPQTP